MTYGKNIHVIGFAGTEGAALLEYLRNKFPDARLTAHNFSRKENFLRDFRNAHTALDKQEALAKGREILELENVIYRFQENYLQGIDQADTIFVPQSWYLYSENTKLEKYREKFRSITGLYFDLFPGKIIGVTGSNGKTTTTNMIAEIMRRAYPSTLYTGNDRRAAQVLEKLDGAGNDDWLVLEISNRQLMFDLGKSPDISVITNITPNHLTEHKSFEDYAATKASILKYQTAKQWSVLNQDDPESRKLIEIDSGETLPFSTEEFLPRGVFLKSENIILKHADREEVLMPASDLPLKGAHNLQNAMAAVAACYLADIDLELIAQTLRSMAPIPQRMELVGTVDGIEYYNDTASTAPESTMAAINTLKNQNNKLTLILGGKSKGLDYGALIKIIAEKVDKIIFLESPLAEELKRGLKNHYDTSTYDNLKEAVEYARKISKPGDLVLLSPAGEYFVYFKDKMPDHKKFRHIVENLN